LTAALFTTEGVEFDSVSAALRAIDDDCPICGGGSATICIRGGRHFPMLVMRAAAKPIGAGRLVVPVIVDGQGPVPGYWWTEHLVRREHADDFAGIECRLIPANAGHFDSRANVEALFADTEGEAE
jgi:hypothetical protein